MKFDIRAEIVMKAFGFLKREEEFWPRRQKLEKEQTARVRDQQRHIVRD